MATSQDNKSGVRALVADDESISRQIIAFALQQEGFDCDSAKDGVEASAMLAVNNYEVVVTDLQMPRRNGFELVREMLANKPTPLVVVHTSVIDPKVAKDLIADGVDDIVFKPVDYPAFASKVRALCTRRQTQRQFHTVTDEISSDPAIESPQSFTESPRDYLNEVLTSLGLVEHDDRVGPYQLGRLFGAGGMGEVYEAEHKLLQRRCAIKFIRRTFLADASTQERFTREVRCAAKLSHWNNVSIFDFGLTRKGHFYYVMELLEGLSLQQLVDDHGPLPPSRTLHFLTQVCDGLEEAHRLGLIHRDIKPSNLMATRSESRSDVLKILDFGLVLDTDSAPLDATVLTQSGGMCGTPAYMAPEQIADASSIDSRADIYALGATAYALVTGKPPFGADNPIKVICSHLHDNVVPPCELNSKVPQDLSGIILKCLDKDPDQRFQSTTELGDRFRACGEFGHWSDTDATLWWARHTSVRTAGASNSSGFPVFRFVE